MREIVFLAIDNFLFELILWSMSMSVVLLLGLHLWCLKFLCSLQRML